MPLLLGGWFLILSILGQAADVKVIANASFRDSSITVEELREVYLRQRRTLKSGSGVMPVLQRSGPTHDAFLRKYLDRDANELRIYYQELVFTGKGLMPKELHSDAEVVAYVSGANSAIGYVSTEADTAGVKVLTILRPGQHTDRKLLTRVQPEYPDTLRKMGIAGTVRLRLTVSPAGAVETATVIGGNPILAEAAVSAVKQWVYSPWPSSTTADVTIPFPPSE